MKEIISVMKGVILLMAVLYSHMVVAQTVLDGQSRFYTANVKTIDSFTKFARTWCDSLQPFTITEEYKKRDKRNIHYLSELYNSISSFKAFAQWAKNNKLEETYYLEAGLTRFHKYEFPENGYINMSILLTVIDDNILFKQFTMDTPNERKCVTGLKIPFFDYGYVQKELLKDIGFPIKGCANCDSLIIDTFYRPAFKEVALKYPDYKFVPDADFAGIRSLIFLNSFCQMHTYDKTVAPAMFVELIQLEKYDELRNMLYSPNQLMAVNAYEALTWLKSRDTTFSLTAAQQAQMKAIASSDTNIPVYCGNHCKPVNYSYHTLKIKEQMILNKYQAVLQNQ